VRLVWYNDARPPLTNSGRATTGRHSGETQNRHGVWAMLPGGNRAR